MRRLRIVAVVAAIAGCHGARNRGPAWPKSAGTVVPDDATDDGGESLEPHASHVAALEVADDATPSASAPAAVTTDDQPATPTETPIAPTGKTIEIQLDDITITPADDIIINGN